MVHAVIRDGVSADQGLKPAVVYRWRRTVLGIVSGKEKRRYSERPIIPTQVQLASDAAWIAPSGMGSYCDLDRRKQ